MLGTRKNLVSDEGSVWEPTFRFKNPDGTPVDLTGWNAELRIVNRFGSMTSGMQPYMVAGDATGELTFKVSSAEMSFPAAKYSYYVNLVDPEGEKHRFLFGELSHRPMVVDN